MTDYKNRCAELAQHLDDTLDFTISSETRKYLKALISTVRSELAEPEPEESTTGGKKPLSLVCNCYMKGMPPNPHQDWQAYFDHCAATGIISGLRLKAIQPTPSVNDSIPYSIPQQPEPERPADEELDNIYWDESWRAGADDPSAINEVGLSEFRLIARAVLARWGRPAIKPVPVAEPEPQRPTLADEAYVAFVQICKGNSDDADTYEADEELVRRALKRLNDLERRPTIEPVLAPPTDCSTAAIIGP